MKIVKVEVVSGCEGPCLCISDESGSGERISGPKPWGGGKAVHTFAVSVDELKRCIDQNCYESE